MGKPYKEDIDRLPDTYAWALRADITDLSAAISACEGSPLLVVGSGGAYTAAHFVSTLHQRYTGRMSKAVTPYEMRGLIGQLHDTTVIVLSAGGGNKDVIGLCRLLAKHEHKRVIVICGRKGSRLSGVVGRSKRLSLFEYELPSVKDGFLATNSLLGFAVLVYRAYVAPLLNKQALPATFRELMHPHKTKASFYKDIEAQSKCIWTRNVFSVLHGPLTHSAAIDLESKFTEAALGAVQLADYRNFAHGRHHWFAKRGEDSAVISFISAEDASLAEKTLSLMPKQVPVLRIHVPHDGPLAGLYSIIMAIVLTRYAGIARSIDPGHPRVPLFGRTIYHLNGFADPALSLFGLNESEESAIVRKTRMTIRSLADMGYLDLWRAAYRRFLGRISDAQYDGIVLDYDGTLCEDPATGLSSEAIAHITRLLKGGITVGIATGRGESVRKELRRSLPARLRKYVTVGYLNGSDIAMLDDDAHPIGGPSDPILKAAVSLLSSHELVAGLVQKIHCYPHQVTIWLKSSRFAEFYWRNANELIQAQFPDILRVSRSDHSVDILCTNASKSNVIEQIKRRKSGSDCKVLCIGDKGGWPGNDFALLSEPLSLSVDETPSSPENCWNIAPSNIRGIRATLYYLESVQILRGSGRFVLDVADGR